jgi:hypothetical protein
MDIEFALSAL